jgi:hypothetical protein
VVSSIGLGRCLASPRAPPPFNQLHAVPHQVVPTDDVCFHLTPPQLDPPLFAHLEAWECSPDTIRPTRFSHLSATCPPQLDPPLFVHLEAYDSAYACCFKCHFTLPPLPSPAGPAAVRAPGGARVPLLLLLLPLAAHMDEAGVPL